MLFQCDISVPPENVFMGYRNVTLEEYGLLWLVFCIRFVWQVHLMKMIIYMFRTQRHLKNPIKHLIWSFLQINLQPEKTLNWFRKKAPFNNLLGSEYASGTLKVILHKCAKKSRQLSKNEKQVLQEKHCVL